MSSYLTSQMVDLNWIDLTIALPQIAGHRVKVHNPSQPTVVEVIFSDSPLSPVNLHGAAIGEGGFAEGVAAHVWVRSLGTVASLSVELLASTDTQAMPITAGSASLGFTPAPGRPFNVMVSAQGSPSAASGVLEKSYPGDGNWYACWIDLSAPPTDRAITDTLTECEAGVAYRLRVITGMLLVRFGQ